MIEYIFKGKPDDFAVMADGLQSRRDFHDLDTPFVAKWFTHGSKIFTLEFFRFQSIGKGRVIVTQEPEGDQSRVMVYPVDDNWMDYPNQDGWAILYSEVKRQLIAVTDKDVENWQGSGKRPKTRAERIKAVEAWDALDRAERPRLEDWLEVNFGSDPATGELLVPPLTFRGWRKYLKKNSS